MLIASPTLQDTFHVAAGSVTGRRHLGSANLLAGKNNQDSYSCDYSADYILLSVFDGCGSLPYSEFGSRLGANIVPAAVAATIKCQGLASIDKTSFWQVVQQNITDRLFKIVSACVNEEEHPLRAHSAATIGFIKRHLFFTMLGALVTCEKTIIFGMGDGVFLVNNQLTCLGPFPDNAPDYLAKSLIDPCCAKKISLHACLRTDVVDTLLVGTDGVVDLIENADKCIPGKKRRIGTLAQIFEEEALFYEVGCTTAEEIESLTGWLRLVNSEVVQIRPGENGSQNSLHRDGGLLPDDTTLLALRRVTPHMT